MHLDHTDGTFSRDPSTTRSFRCVPRGMDPPTHSTARSSPGPLRNPPVDMLVPHQRIGDILVSVPSERRLSVQFDLLRGRIDLFSTDALIDILARLGARVRLTVKPGRRNLKVA